MKKYPALKLGSTSGNPRRQEAASQSSVQSRPMTQKFTSSESAAAQSPACCLRGAQKLHSASVSFPPRESANTPSVEVQPPPIDLPSSAAVTVPVIYTRTIAPPALTWWGRGLAAAISLGSLGVLIVGAWLTPDPSGISTHTEMGFLPCQFERRTGLPCPSCGYTSSVSWFAHGNPIASFYVQPMGFVIALCLAAAVWVGAYIAITNRPVHRLAAYVPGRTWLWVLLGFAMGGWAWKIFIHLGGRDGWR